MSNPNPSAHPAPAPLWLVALPLLARAASGVFLATHTTLAAGGCASSAPLNRARLLAATGAAFALAVLGHPTNTAP